MEQMIPRGLSTSSMKTFAVMSKNEVYLGVIPLLYNVGHARSAEKTGVKTRRILQVKTVRRCGGDGVRATRNSAAILEEVLKS